MIGTAPAAGPSATVSEERSLWKLACLTAPLVCLLVVIQHFDLESKAFFRLFAIAVAGFVVQYFLPLKTPLVLRPAVRRRSHLDTWRRPGVVDCRTWRRADRHLPPAYECSAHVTAKPSSVDSAGGVSPRFACTCGRR